MLKLGMCRILKQYSITQPEIVPKLVSLANGELHQACGHVMLSTWPKNGHMLSVSCTPLHLCSCSWVLSGSRSTPWPAWFSDVLLFPKFWHLTNLWHDFLSLHDLLRPTCSFLLPCSGCVVDWVLNLGLDWFIDWLITSTTTPTTTLGAQVEMF